MCHVNQDELSHCKRVDEIEVCLACIMHDGTSYLMSFLIKFLHSFTLPCRKITLITVFTILSPVYSFIQSNFTTYYISSLFSPFFNHIIICLS